MYPRESGHCQSHHIPRNVVIPVDECELSNQELTNALSYLRKNNADLVKGDLIIFDAVAGYRNDGVAIFDGVSIINLSYEPDDYGNLPKSFRVIEDNVPINYWSTENGLPGISHNNIVWFDHSKVLTQCLHNIRHLSTSFIYNDEQYRIVYEKYDNIDDPSELEFNLRFILNDITDLIPFESFSEEFPELNDGKTLFIKDY